MAHMIMMADTYGNFHQCFRAFMDKRGKCDKYKSSWGVKMREIKLYDVIYAEEDEQQLLADLKHFDYNRGNGLITKVVTYVMRIFMGKVKPLNFDGIKATEFTKEEKRMNPYTEWFCYVKPIGKIKDAYTDEIGEML